MKAEDIAWSLVRERWRRAFVLERYTPRSWWECDVFEVTRAGFFREYEIKLTLDDFKADARKAKGGRWTPKVTKHERLAARDPKGPTRFWYVTPAGLLALDQLPEWAGLIEMQADVVLGQPRGFFGCEVRPAPLLHRARFGDERMKHPRSVLYYRLHEANHRMRRLLEGSNNL